jgi:hypothetical protein
VCTNAALDYEKAAEFEIPIKVTDVNAPTLQTGTGKLIVLSNIHVSHTSSMPHTSNFCECHWPIHVNVFMKNFDMSPSDITSKWDISFFEFSIFFILFSFFYFLSVTICLPLTSHHLVCIGMFGIVWPWCKKS